MITIANNKINKAVKYTDEQVNAKYLELMPLIRQIAQRAFREYDAEKRDDAVQSVLVAAFINVKQLAEKGKLDEAFATPIAWFGVGHYRQGRIGGLPQNSTDVFGETCRYKGRSRIKHFGLAENITDSFESEATATDARYPVHKTVALRIDFFETWYASQSPRDREIIKDLAMGETTGDVAKKYGVSPGAVSQWRRKYADSWYAFINPVEEVDLIEELKALAAETEGN